MLAVDTKNTHWQKKDRRRCLKSNKTTPQTRHKRHFVRFGGNATGSLEGCGHTEVNYGYGLKMCVRIRGLFVRERNYWHGIVDGIQCYSGLFWATGD